ncbi:ankyrin repeat-containing domain protein [Aspergillus californicus]
MWAMAKLLEPKINSLAGLIPELQWITFNHLSFDEKVVLTEDGLFHPDLLIGHGAVSAFNEQGRTLLHVAAEKGCENATRHILCAGASASAKMGPGARDPNTTPLIIAAGRGHRGIIKLLLDHRANIDDWDFSGVTALHYAAMHGNSDIVQILLEHGAQQINNYDIGCPVHVAAGGGHLDILRLLVAHGADVAASRRGSSPLQIALFNENVTAARILVEAGAPVDDTSDADLYNTTLMVAAGPHVVEAADTALDCSIACVVRKGKMEWKGRQKEEYAELLQAMIMAGANPNQSFRSATALHLAVIVGNSHAVRILLEAGADVHRRTDRGRSAYLLSCLFHDADIKEQIWRARQERTEPERPDAPPKPRQFSVLDPNY